MKGTSHKTSKVKLAHAKKEAQAHAAHHAAHAKKIVPAAHAKREEPGTFRLAAMAAHVLLFALAGPAILLLISEQVQRSFLIYQKLIPEPSSAILGAALILLGIALYIWSVRAQLMHGGGGSPFPFHPFRKLVTHAPYTLSRNPMVLGVLLSYLGLSFALNSFASLLLVLLFSAAALGYAKLFEERELEQRFGSAYLGYKKKTPFLLPGI